MQALRDSGIQTEMQSVPTQFDLPIATVHVTVFVLLCHLSPPTTIQLARVIAE